MTPLKKTPPTDDNNSDNGGTGDVFSTGTGQKSPRILKDSRVADNLLIRLANTVLRLIQRATQHITSSASDEQKAAGTDKGKGV
jgi:hypothetical protein